MWRRLQPAEPPKAAVGTLPGPHRAAPELDEGARIRVVGETWDADLSGLAVAPWVAGGGTSRQEGPPVLNMTIEEADTTAEGRVAVTADAILLKVIVHDDTHFNERTGGDIWDGDSLQIGVDALGDGSGREPADAQLVGLDDAELAAALAPDGVTVWAHFHGRPDGVGHVEEAQIMQEELQAAGWGG